jgi:hypothetical protein
MKVFKITPKNDCTKYYIVHKGSWYKCRNLDREKGLIALEIDPIRKAKMLGWDVPQLLLSSPLEILLVMNLSRGEIMERIEKIIRHRHLATILRAE